MGGMKGLKVKNSLPPYLSFMANESHSMVNGNHKKNAGTVIYFCLRKKLKI